jgi:Zn-dependent peptidase ImmA (M78 family)
MALRRGFKSEANWYAKEMRRELRLTSYGVLCPWKLADHLGFPVVPLTAFAVAEPEMVAFFRSGAGQIAFSAITLFNGRKPLIIHNDAHERKRQAADIAHELAHGLLNHPPKPPIATNGSRDYNAVLEEEANWLGPSLLISDEAAVHIAERKLSIADASEQYGASEPLVQYRLNVSGALKRLARRRAA